jgi:hypothetical protein
VLIPAARPLPQNLSRLLELRLRDPRRLRRLLAGDGEAIDAADAAFVQGDNVTARNAYLRRVTMGDIEAWTGLFLALHRMAGPAADSPLPQQPELIAAVFERIRAVAGAAPHPRALITWLAPERRA